MNTLTQYAQCFDRVIQSSLKWLCIALFVAITLILTLNIIVRFVPIMSMHWFDEILELLYGALIFYGAALVWVNNSHFSVGDWLSPHIPSLRARAIYRLCIELASLVFIVVFFYYATELLLKTEEQTTAFALSKKWLYLCMPLGGGLMMLYSLKNTLLKLQAVIQPQRMLAHAAAENLNH